MTARQHTRTGTAVAVATGLIVCTGGCAGDPADAEDAHAGADAVAVLHKAAGALVSAGSSKARTAMEMATGGPASPFAARASTTTAGRSGS
ncbi:hypothetical protein SAV31267_052440 [Streptomyces avermitilis]|uniref:Uncharacterized protein n=1 Tax=Streptomyces avermitilis TaxID=33903 RepID=A0A4D4MWN0_STRAX|nr:hypothetical protein SAV31267_052440 [Streptomyces avermitilis]